MMLYVVIVVGLCMRCHAQPDPGIVDPTNAENMLTNLMGGGDPSPDPITGLPPGTDTGFGPDAGMGPGPDAGLGPGSDAGMVPDTGSGGTTDPGLSFSLADLNRMYEGMMRNIFYDYSGQPVIDPSAQPVLDFGYIESERNRLLSAGTGFGPRPSQTGDPNQPPGGGTGAAGDAGAVDGGATGGAGSTITVEFTKPEVERMIQGMAENKRYDFQGRETTATTNVLTREQLDMLMAQFEPQATTLKTAEFTLQQVEDMIRRSNESFNYQGNIAQPGEATLTLEQLMQLLAQFKSRATTLKTAEFTLQQVEDMIRRSNESFNYQGNIAQPGEATLTLEQLMQLLAQFKSRGPQTSALFSIPKVQDMIVGMEGGQRYNYNGLPASPGEPELTMSQLVDLHYRLQANPGSELSVTRFSRPPFNLADINAMITGSDTGNVYNYAGQLAQPGDPLLTMAQLLLMREDYQSAVPDTTDSGAVGTGQGVTPSGPETTMAMTDTAAPNVVDSGQPTDPNIQGPQTSAAFSISMVQGMIVGMESGTRYNYNGQLAAPGEPTLTMAQLVDLHYRLQANPDSALTVNASSRPPFTLTDINDMISGSDMGKFYNYVGQLAQPGDPLLTTAQLLLLRGEYQSADTTSQPVNGQGAATGGQTGTPDPNTGAVDPGMTDPNTGAVDPGMTDPNTGAVDPGMNDPNTGAVDPGMTDPNTGAVDPGMTDPNIGAVDPGMTDPNIGAVDPGMTDPNTGAVDPGITDPNTGAVDPGMTDPNTGAVDPGITDPNAGAVDPGMTDPNAGAVDPGITDPNAGAVDPGMTDPNTGAVDPGMTDPNTGAVDPGMTDPNKGAIDPGMTDPNAGAVDPGMTDPNTGAVDPGMTDPNTGAVDPGMSDPNTGAIDPGMTDPNTGAVDPGMTGPNTGAVDPGMSDPNTGAVDPGMTDPNAGAVDPGMTDPNTGAVDPGMTDPNAGAVVPGMTDPNTGAVDPGMTDPNTGAVDPGITDPNTGAVDPGMTDPNAGFTDPGTIGSDPSGPLGPNLIVPDPNVPSLVIPDMTQRGSATTVPPGLAANMARKDAGAPSVVDSAKPLDQNIKVSNVVDINPLATGGADPVPRRQGPLNPMFTTDQVQSFINGMRNGMVYNFDGYEASPGEERMSLAYLERLLRRLQSIARPDWMQARLDPAPCRAYNCNLPICYVPYKDDCKSYVVCQQTAMGTYVAWKMRCAFGSYWDNNNMWTCERVEDLAEMGFKCPNDKCRNSNIKSYPDEEERNCRTYWKCENRMSRPACCPPGQMFDRTSLTCRNDPLEKCRSPCPLRREGCANTLAKTQPFYDGNCRTYWDCAQGRPHPVCCPAGQTYSTNNGSCTVDPSCTDACPAQYAGNLCGKIAATGTAKTSSYALDDGNCRTFMKCFGGDYGEPWCCRQQYYYNTATFRCEPLSDYLDACNQAKCPEGYKEECPFKAHPTDPLMFIDRESDLPQKCSNGTSFDESICTCGKSVSFVPVNTCKKGVHTLFDDPQNLYHVKNYGDGWISVYGKMLKNVTSRNVTYGSFNGANGMEVWRYDHTSFPQVTLKIVFQPNSVQIPGTDKQTLVSNCKSVDGKDASFEVSVVRSKSRVVFRGQTANGVAELVVPYNHTAWNTYQLLFDGETAIAMIEDPETGMSDSSSTQLFGEILAGVGSLKFGPCVGSRNGFVGYVSEVVFSKCVDEANQQQMFEVMRNQSVP